MPIANVPYQIVEAKAGSKMVIPCDLTTEGVTGDEMVDFKWGFTPDGTDSYRTIVQRNDIKLHPGMPHDLRVHLHPTHTTQEDCSLVISPLLVEDSGIYEIQVTVNGAQRGPIQKTKVLVTESPLMSSGKKFSARREAMFKLPESLLNARSVDEGQTTGEEYNSMHIATDHRPVNKINSWHVPMAYRPVQTPTVDEEQTVVVEEGQARPGKEGQVRPGNEGQARPGNEGQARPGKEGQARPGNEGQARPGKEGQARHGKEGQARPGKEGQARPGKERQASARPVDEGQTTGEEYNSMHIATDHRPVNKINSWHVPMAYHPVQTPTVDEEQTVVVEEGQARPEKEGQVRPGNEGQARPGNEGQARPGKEGQARPGNEGQARPGKEGQARPGNERQARPGNERQARARPVDEGQTSGKKLKAKRKPAVHHPVTATIQTVTADEEQTTTVHKKTKNQGKTTDKKLRAKHKPMVNRPVTTTADKQTATVNKEPIVSGGDFLKKFLIIWNKFSPFLLKYAGIPSFIITAIIFVFIFIFCVGTAVGKYRKRKLRKQEESRMEEGRLEQDDDSEDEF
ncbi:uncharacterized protein LOC143926556 [Lithobates pipiens]